MSTYPLQAVALDDDGTPWYPFRPAEGEPVLYLADPVLPHPNAVWATTPDDFADRPHVDLDVDHLAQLLYLIPNLDTVTYDAAPAVIHQCLKSCKCDANRLSNWISNPSGMDVMRARHMTQARDVAQRLLSA